MKYWIKKPDWSDFIGPLTINEIVAEAERGFLNDECEVLEASGQSFGALNKATGWTVISSIYANAPAQKVITGTPHKTIEQNTIELPLSYLEGVRSKTCYTALRELIALVSAVALVLFVLLAVFSVITGVQKEDSTVIITGLAIGGVGCFFALASKQASVLLIDIADVLIDQNRRK